MEGWGLRSAERTRWRACWASWADTLPMIRERHPEVADVIMYNLEGGAISPCLCSACRAATTLDGWMGLECLLCLRSLLVNARPSWKWRTGSVPRQGWQHAQSGSSLVPDRNSDAQDESRGTGTVEVLSQLSTHANPFSFVQGASPAPPPSPSSFVQAHGFGKEGFRSGEWPPEFAGKLGAES